jgi:hypothetical protein
MSWRRAASVLGRGDAVVGEGVGREEREGVGREGAEAALATVAEKAARACGLSEVGVTTAGPRGAAT